jgi:hypothetical protein
VFPQGAAGVGGSGGSGTAQSLSGIPFVSNNHVVSFNSIYYSVNGAASNFSETPAVVTWVPGACTLSRLTVFSQQDNQITVTLRLGPSPSTLADTVISCVVAQGNSCTGTGSVGISAGSFVDLSITGSSGNAASVWTAVECD